MMKAKNKPTNRRKHYIVVLIMLLLCACTIGFIYLKIIEQSDSVVKSAFLHAILNRDSKADSYITNELRAYANQHCPQGSILECALEYMPNSWGKLTDLRFIIGSGSRNTSLYHTYWSQIDDPISIVIIISDEDGRWLVDGWRGFIPSSGENLDSKLLRGYRLDNQFPPEQ